MDKLKSPFNFVPLNQKVYIPNWWNQVSQDVPFSDGTSGEIKVRIESQTPICVQDNHDNAVRRMFCINGEYFIPATSIRGMLRSTIEILSFGRLRQYNNDYFGYRDIANVDKDMKGHYGFIVNEDNVHAGWLRKKDGCYYLSPCTEFKTVSHFDIRKKYPCFNDKASNLIEKQQSLAGKDNLYPYYGDNMQLVCTGNFGKKSKEYLFSTLRGKDISIDGAVKDKFLTIHRQYKPVFDELFVGRLNENCEVPVFFTYDIEGKVDNVGLTRNMKIAYKHPISDFIRQDSIEGLDLCELMFGTVETESLKGRVFIGHAFAEAVSSREEGQINCILGTPKASYYPIYLRQQKSPYKNFDSDDAIIAGRKRYRVRDAEYGGRICKLPIGEGKKNDNVYSRFIPLRAGAVFHFTIRLHNLRPAEIGALLWAITLNDTEGCYHNIGVGKGLGYGKIKCAIESMDLDDAEPKDIDFYRAAFEREMESHISGWLYSPQVTTLVAISREHKNNEALDYMTLQEYKENKKSFNILKESDAANIVSRCNTKEEACARLKDSLKEDDQKAHKVAKEGDYVGAITIYFQIIDKLWRSNCDTSKEEEQIALWKEEHEKRKAILVQQENEEHEKSKREMIGQGLGTNLNRIAEGGKFVVSSWKQCRNALDLWMRKKEEKSLDDTERQELEAIVERLFAAQKHDEKKDWTTDGKIWKSIASYLGEDAVHNLKDRLLKIQ